MSKLIHIYRDEWGYAKLFACVRSGWTKVAPQLFTNGLSTMQLNLSLIIGSTKFPVPFLRAKNTQFWQTVLWDWCHCNTNAHTKAGLQEQAVTRTHCQLFIWPNWMANTRVFNEWNCADRCLAIEKRICRWEIGICSRKYQQIIIWNSLLLTSVEWCVMVDNPTTKMSDGSLKWKMLWLAAVWAWWRCFTVGVFGGLRSEFFMRYSCRYIIVYCNIYYWNARAFEWFEMWNVTFFQMFVMRVCQWKCS